MRKLLLLVALVDQSIKITILCFIDVDQKISIYELLNLNVIFNDGLAFNLFPKLNYRCFLFSICATGICILQMKRQNILILLALYASISNIFDRLLLGFVIDYLDFHIKFFHWYTFNLSDMILFICILISFKKY